jgi:acyl carrier protein
MELDNFLSEFCSILDDTDISIINKNTNFRNLSEWNSLLALSLIAMIDENYNLSINGDDFSKLNTIEELYNFLIILENEK